MAATTVWYGAAFRDREAAVANAGWAYLTDTIKCSLHTAGYVANVDSDKFWSTATNEVASANYTSGGVTLTTKTITYDTATNETRYDADDEAWTTVTIAPTQGVFYKSSGVAGTSPLIWQCDFGGAQSVVGANFTIVNAATGVAKAVS